MTALNGQAAGEMLSAMFASAMENGWNIEQKMIPDEPGVPVLIIAVIQPEDLAHWVGLDIEPSGNDLFLQMSNETKGEPDGG